MRVGALQDWANRRKTIQKDVRHKYALLADNELNRRLDEEYKKFCKAIQMGKPLPPLVKLPKVVDV